MPFELSQLFFRGQVPEADDLVGAARSEELAVLGDSYGRRAAFGALALFDFRAFAAAAKADGAVGARGGKDLAIGRKNDATDPLTAARRFDRCDRLPCSGFPDAHGSVLPPAGS